MGGIEDDDLADLQRLFDVIPMAQDGRKEKTEKIEKVRKLTKAEEEEEKKEKEIYNYIAKKVDTYIFENFGEKRPNRVKDTTYELKTYIEGIIGEKLSLKTTPKEKNKPETLGIEDIKDNMWNQFIKQVIEEKDLDSSPLADLGSNWKKRLEKVQSNLNNRVDIPPPNWQKKLEKKAKSTDKHDEPALKAVNTR